MRPELDAQLLIGGDGPERAALGDLAATLGLADRVHFLGLFDDEHRWTIYSAGDACVVSSRSLEGFGYGALEGLAAGRPTIVTNVGGLPEVVAALEPRWVVPVDAIAIAAAVSELVGDGSDLPDADACRAYAHQFSWDAIHGRVLEIYREAIAER
jgi:glycosyltransferase involved in cell wall biosynthesis